MRIQILDHMGNVVSAAAAFDDHPLIHIGYFIYMIQRTDPFQMLLRQVLDIHDHAFRILDLNRIYNRIPEISGKEHAQVEIYYEKP